MAEFGVVAQGVARRFGTAWALRGLDLTVPYGQVTALVGPNGAGKTTLLLILATLLRRLAGQGAAILVSSHILTELEEIADRVVFVNAGVTVDEKDIGSLAASAESGWRVRATDPEALREALMARGVSAGPSTGAGTELPAMTEEAAADLLAALVAAGVRVVAYGPVGSPLESVYMAMTQERR